jgi:hypothetical protein
MYQTKTLVTRPCICIEYRVADALTEVRTVLSIREEKLVTGARCCRLSIIPSDDPECDNARITTQILITNLLGERVWFPVGNGASERLLRALFDMAATSSNGRPVSVLLAGTMVMNLGDLKENS